MHLSQNELDKLQVHSIGYVAQRRLARGLRLSQPETVALITSQLLELLRDGRTAAELLDLGPRILGRNEVMEGVAELVSEIYVEAVFPEGPQRLIIHKPIALEYGELSLALYGSFLPIPNPILFSK